MGSSTRHTKKKSKHKLSSERKEKIRNYLKKLGIWSEIQKTNLCDSMLNSYYPKLTVGVESDVQSICNSDEILSSVKEVINNTTVWFSPLNQDVLVSDLCSLILPLYQAIKLSHGSSQQTKDTLERVRARNKYDDFPDFFADAVSSLTNSMNDRLAKFCRIDANLYKLIRTSYWNESGKYIIRYILCHVPAQIKKIATDKGVRAAYRCGAPCDGGFAWVKLPRSLFSNNNGPDLPVYVHGHVLDMLYRKPSEARLNFIENGDGTIHDYLWWSLCRPKVLPIVREPGRVPASKSQEILARP